MRNCFRQFVRYTQTLGDYVFQHKTAFRDKRGDLKDRIGSQAVPFSNTTKLHSTFPTEPTGKNRKNKSLSASLPYKANVYPRHAVVYNVSVDLMHDVCIKQRAALGDRAVYIFFFFYFFFTVLIHFVSFLVSRWLFSWPSCGHHISTHVVAMPVTTSQNQ